MNRPDRHPAAARRERRAAIDDPAVVLEAAAAFLAVRPRSIAETCRRLRRLGYRPELVEAVVARLVELGYLDDAAFGRAWLESRDRARPRGEAVLRRELFLKGLAGEVVGELLAERAAGAGEGGDTGALGDVDLAAALRLLERRSPALLRDPDARRRRERAFALLARNGFDSGICREAVGRWEGAADAASDDPPRAPDDAASGPWVRGRGV